MKFSFSKTKHMKFMTGFSLQRNEFPRNFTAAVNNMIIGNIFYA